MRPNQQHRERAKELKAHIGEYVYHRFPGTERELWGKAARLILVAQVWCTVSYGRKLGTRRYEANHLALVPDGFRVVADEWGWPELVRVVEALPARCPEITADRPRVDDLAADADLDTEHRLSPAVTSAVT
jgi:hypothetical protein